MTWDQALTWLLVALAVVSLVLRVVRNARRGPACCEVGGHSPSACESCPVREPACHCSEASARRPSPDRATL